MQILRYCFFITMLPVAAWAQQVRVQGGFLDDSVRLAENIPYYLVVSYPKDRDMIMPDSSYDFSPFVFTEKKYFPTHTHDSISTDSVVYYIQTFETDSVLQLDLPVYELAESDCVIYRSRKDSIFFIHLVNRLPDSLTADLPLKATVAYQKVPMEVNYQLIIALLSVFLISVAVMWLLFGKQLMRKIRLISMRQAHKTFIETYDRYVTAIRESFDPQRAEKAVGLWKRYMENLLSRPYARLTTREMIALSGDEDMGKNLRAIDSAIYGYNQQVVDPLEELKKIADQQFMEKYDELKNG